MKKLLLYIFAVCTFQIAAGQGFTISPKIVRVQGPSSQYKLDATADFTNTGTDTEFEWMIIDIVSPATWSYGMCDPLNCLTDLKVGTKGVFVVGTNKSGQFIGDFILNGKSGIGTAKIIIYPKSNVSLQDTLIFLMNSWVTSIKEASGALKEFVYYPNPVKDRLQIKYNTKETLNIDIYNVLGNKVKSFVHTGFESDINVSDLQNGIYFIRFRDGNHTFSKPFTKSE
ncbi:MAG: T9SS type A sorting domain-containing protein [Bacteroidia bacterium]|nr:T9SS type A sorting domain-containing protein [Bacteroidia bacterium]